MGSRRSKSVPRKMRKVAVVICEGETEAEYVNLLRRWFHSSIKIVSHIEGTKITPELVDKRVNEHKLSNDDVIYSFLMYDLDVPEIAERLQNCNAKLLVSNPCIEVWFLLHTMDHKRVLDSAAIKKELMRSDPVWRLYEKSRLSATQRQHLIDNIEIAISRAKDLKELANPSSTIYKLIELLRAD